jgi:hypothetical protein
VMQRLELRHGVVKSVLRRRMRRGRSLGRVRIDAAGSDLRAASLVDHLGHGLLIGRRRRMSRGL